MIGSVFIILISFSILWLFVWIWFFKGNKSSGEKAYKEGIKAFETGDYVKAKKILSKIKDIPDAKYNLGVAQLNLGEYEKAKECFEQILKTSPKNFDALFKLAEILQAEKNYDSALEKYNKAIIENSKNPECYLNISNIYCEKEDFNKALEVLEKANEIVPDNTQILFDIIKCKSKLANMEDEEECQKIMDEYTKLAERSDLPSEFHTSFAKVSAVCGDIEKTFENCQKAIALNSEDIEAYQLLGLVQLIMKDIEGAKNSLTIALNFQSNNKELHNIFSYVLCQTVSSCSLEKCRERYFKLIKKHLK